MNKINELIRSYLQTESHRTHIGPGLCLLGFLDVPCAFEPVKKKMSAREYSVSSSSSVCFCFCVVTQWHRVVQDQSWHVSSRLSRHLILLTSIRGGRLDPLQPTVLLQRSLAPHFTSVTPRCTLTKIPVKKILYWSQSVYLHLNIHKCIRLACEETT